MESVLQNVSTAVILVSIAVSVLAGAFMGIQALVDPPRRRAYVAFAATWWFLVAADLLSSSISRSTYELLRLAWCGGYAGALLWLLEEGGLRAAAAALLLPATGAAVWFAGYPEAATTVAFPSALAVAALAHGRRYVRSRGYASAVLCAFSVAMALECATYLFAIETGDFRVIALGYIHWGLLTTFSVLFGWVQLPRELRGRAPVRVEPGVAAAFIAAVAAGEAGVLAGQLLFFRWPPVGYVAGSIVVFGSTLLLYFHHRHRLIIHTDNVTELLETRTASLREAREALARQNELQALKLREQAAELQARGAVIERQRRLELAAQTAGQAAHDIQNLIAPILAQLSVLQRDAGSAHEVRESVDRIRRQVDELLDLNGQLLALSRRGRLDFEPVRVDELAREIAGRFPADRLTVETEGELWIRGSWSQLSRALSNLVQNAVEAGPVADGRVTVRCGTADVTESRRCHLGFLPPGRYVRMEVEDRGPGIPPGILDRIFEPFFSSKTGPARSGSGLGLSIVAAVVDDHRGVLDLETGPGGTRFTLYMPPLTAAVEAETLRPLSDHATVLVVDDDSAVLRHCWSELEEAGFEVQTAASGAEALRVLQTVQIDVLVFDLKMPGLSGPETYLGAMNLRPGLRAVVHTAYATDEEVAQLRGLGVSAVLLKPAGRNELLRAVRAALSERRADVRGAYQA